MAEVREKVLKYIPVMARPMVMYRDKHPIQWTGVYADVSVSHHFIECCDPKAMPRLNSGPR